ncbi:iron-containing alcohol dehydrogenase [bacterium]|nr:iron-containing alcohol dehydrogenase [bacterium]
MSRILRSLPRKVMVVHSKSFQSLGFKKAFEEASQLCSRFPKFFLLEGEPSISEVLSLSNQLQDFSCVAAVGGGAVQDLSALGALGCLKQGELESHLYTGKGSPKRAMREIGLVSFPTNYSSGSFVSETAVILANGYKCAVFGPGLRPDKVFIDPLVLTSMKPNLLNLSAVDTLTHFIEIYVGVEARHSLYHQALEGWWIDFQRAFSSRDSEVLFFLSAHLLGGFFPLSTGGWPIHALAHALGPICSLNHCESLAVLLPHFLKSYLEAYPDHNETLKQCGSFYKSLSLEIPSPSKKQMEAAVTMANSMNSRLFEGADGLEEYHHILEFWQ